MAISARTLRVEWAYMSSAEPPVDTFIIMVSGTLGDVNIRRTITVPDGNAREYLVTGLQPYSYTSSTGAQFIILMEARNSIGTSDQTGISPITLPRKSVIHTR